MAGVDETQRELFDRHLEEVLAALPEDVARLLNDIPLIVEDEPSTQTLRDMGIEVPAGEESDLCGTHWGIPLGSRSVLDGEPELDRIQIFRGPILRLAGKRKGELRRQIRITVLHEIAHHFGLDEDELEELGYG